jgi:CBS domain-containing protein
MSMEIKNIMTPHTRCLHPEATLEDAAIYMRDYNCGFLPICARDKLVGVITDRDIVIRAIASGKHPQQTLITDYMTRGVVYCMAHDELKTVAEQMGNHHVRRIVVLDDNKRAIGVLSIDDIAAKVDEPKLSGEIMAKIDEQLVNTGR